jgi:predicted flap endonuclease-1-like 5' DNA nuclease
MFYLLSQFWLWLLVALIIGGVVGWMTFRGWYQGFFRDLWPWGLFLGLGTLIATLRVFKDGPGFWFDLAMLLATFYFIGCFLGWLLRLRKGDVAAPALAVAGTTIARVASPAPAAPVAVKETPVEAAKVAAAPAEEPAREEAITGLSGPRGGKADNLTCIHGIDDATEAKLNALGIYHHDQLANMTPGQRRWLFNKLGYADRFPSWWWRWRYDAEQIIAGKLQCPPKGAAVAAPMPGAAAPALVAAPAPAPAAAPVGADGHAGSKPKGIEGPRGGKADDLKRIRGIGKQNEGRLHALGIWHFDQVAAWSPEEALWVGSYLAFPGRIEREEWVKQAGVLAQGQETEFSKRVARGEVATSKDDGSEGQGNVAKLDTPVTPPPKK